MGYGMIRVQQNSYEFLSMGTIHLSKLENHHKRLKRIYERVSYLVKEYKPSVCAIESPFYGKNVQSMLKLGRAQGVAIAAMLTAEIPVFEYAPKKIKQSITGSGNASKNQVAAMINRLLEIKNQSKYFDATDGIAVALCHHFQTSRTNNGSSSHTSWEEYIKSNPDKVT